MTLGEQSPISPLCAEKYHEEQRSIYGSFETIQSDEKGTRRDN